MFDIKEEQCNTKTHRLLFNIWQELRKLNGYDPYKEMKRPELMKEVKKLKDKPKGWTKFSNEQLIELLRGEKDA